VKVLDELEDLEKFSTPAAWINENSTIVDSESNELGEFYLIRDEKFIVVLRNNAKALIECARTLENLSFHVMMTWHNECTPEQLRQADYRAREALAKLEKL
jgi:hypothetical protein